MKKQKPSKTRAPPGRRPKGFDFGLDFRTAVIPDVEFNEQLFRAKIHGCGYFLQHDQEFGTEVPTIALVGENETALRTAFERFKGWGCERDGDVVDIQFVFRANGGFDMAISADFERNRYRIMPQADFIQPIIFNVAYIKQFDTTSQQLRDIEVWNRSPLAPVRIAAALGRPGPQGLREVWPLSGLPRLVKFGVAFRDENSPVNLSRPTWFDAMKTARDNPKSPKDIERAPDQIRTSRTKAFDFVFPVSRERFKRADIMANVAGRDEFKTITRDQVLQAALNLLISAEICDGQLHYLTLGKTLQQTIWKHLIERYEVADKTNKFDSLNINDVCQQIELDARELLLARGYRDNKLSIPKMQHILLKKGFVSG